MKSLVNFVYESENDVMDSETVKAYFDDIHKGLKTAINKALKETNNIVYDLEKTLGNDAGIILDKSQVYDYLVEAKFFDNLNVGFKYEKDKNPSRGNTDYVCTQTGFKDKLRNKFSAKDFSIQVKTSILGSKAFITQNYSGIDEPSFYVLISCKRNGRNISLDQAWFGYLTPEDWSKFSHQAQLHTSIFAKKLNKTIFEI